MMNGPEHAYEGRRSDANVGRWTNRWDRDEDEAFEMRIRNPVQSVRDQVENEVENAA